MQARSILGNWIVDSGCGIIMLHFSILPQELSKEDCSILHDFCETADSFSKFCAAAG